MIRRIRHRIKKGWSALALLSVEMIILLIVFTLSLVAFVLITRNVFILKNEVFDYKVFDFLQEHVNEKRNNLMLFITFLGTHLFLIPANLVLIVYFLFIRKHKWYSIKIPVIAITSLLLMVLLKNLFGRQRPDIPLLREAHGLSFPSGHALMSVTFYGLLIYIVWNTVTRPWLKWTLVILLFLLIIVIGFTRIYLRVHYPSDVFAGFAIGFLWLFISVWIMRRIEKFSKREIAPMVQP
jgi:membrane-associated phospholipid phosphatase